MSEILRDICQSLFHPSWMKILLLPPYLRMATLLEVQLQAILVQIR